MGTGSCAHARQKDLLCLVLVMGAGASGCLAGTGTKSAEGYKYFLCPFGIPRYRHLPKKGWGAAGWRFSLVCRIVVELHVYLAGRQIDVSDRMLRERNLAIVPGHCEALVPTREGPLVTADIRQALQNQPTAWQTTLSRCGGRGTGDVQHDSVVCASYYRDGVSPRATRNNQEDVTGYGSP